MESCRKNASTVCVIALVNSDDITGVLEDYQRRVHDSFAAAYYALKQRKTQVLQEVCNIQHAFLRVAHHPELVSMLQKAGKYQNRKVQYLLLSGENGKFELVSSESASRDANNIPETIREFVREDLTRDYVGNHVDKDFADLLTERKGTCSDFFVVPSL